MPPSSDDLPGRKVPRKQRRAAERTEKKKSRGKQPSSLGAAMRWEVPDRAEDHYPQGECACGRDLADTADLGGCPVVSAGGDPGRADGTGAVRPAQGQVRLPPGSCRGPPCGCPGFRPVDRAAAACPGGVPGRLPACSRGAVPGSDQLHRHRPQARPQRLRRPVRPHDRQPVAIYQAAIGDLTRRAGIAA